MYRILPRYIQENEFLRRGLYAVVGLGLADLPAERQLEMMKAVTTARYKQASSTHNAESFRTELFALLTNMLSNILWTVVEKQGQMLYKMEMRRLAIALARYCRRC